MLRSYLPAIVFLILGTGLGGLFVALASVQFGLVVVFAKVASNRGVRIESMLPIRFGIRNLCDER